MAGRLQPTLCDKCGGPPDGSRCGDRLRAKRFIFTSSMVTLARYAGTPAVEASEFDWWHEAPHYVKSRVLAERAVLEAQVNHGLPAIVLCVANTYGPEDYGPTPHGNALWQAPNTKQPPWIAAYPRWISAMQPTPVCAEQHGRVGERYAIVNELIRQRDFYAMAGSELGHPPPKSSPCEKPMSLPRSPKSSIESKALRMPSSAAPPCSYRKHSGNES